jgi:hypothetical protein
MRLRPQIVAGTLALVALPLAAGGQAVKPKYPEGYRSWTHVKSMVIDDKAHPLFEAFGGIHHVYANAPAARALREGKAYPDGSVLVFDLLEVKADGGARVEGPRKFVAVMVKDGKAYRQTGGWGFEAFKADSRDRVVTDPASQCFACHQAQQPRDYVFSEYRR